MTLSSGINFTLSLSFTLILALQFSCTGQTEAASGSRQLYWIKVEANSAAMRAQIAATGVSIESVRPDYVVLLGTAKNLETLKKKFKVDLSFEVSNLSAGFPPGDRDYHTEESLNKELFALQMRFPNLVGVREIGRSYENRPLYAVKLGSQKDGFNEAQDGSGVQTIKGGKRPAALFIAGQHAREHLAVEVALGLIQYLTTTAGKDPKSREGRLLASRDVYILPMMNPDGAVFDVSEDKYQLWRKNRHPLKNLKIGVDLNRNFPLAWGATGSSDDPDSDTYAGENPLSEVENQVLAGFIEGHPEITTMISYHSFSQLILYPWSATSEAIPDAFDLAVFQAMGARMAALSGYHAEQSSAIYPSGGDTCDWAYKERKIFCFTFEVDPRSLEDGGFYPGNAAIPHALDKNREAALYLIEKAANPGGVLDVEKGPNFVLH